MTRKVGILGTGIVGNTLMGGFKDLKFEARQGGRKEFNEIAKWAELLVLSVKGTVAAEALALIDPKNLVGKTIIDTTNPIADLPPEDGVLQFFTSPNESLMETLQTKAPKANFVKAFSSVGAGLMVRPKLQGGKPSMFICGNDSAAKKAVAEIVMQFGWECEDMGSAKAARAIEPLCQLWCIPGLRNNQWNHAFKLLKG